MTIALTLPNQRVGRRIRRKNNCFYEKKSVYFSEVDRAPDAGEAEGQRDRHRPDPPAQVGPTPPPPPEAASPGQHGGQRRRLHGDPRGWPRPAAVTSLLSPRPPGTGEAAAPLRLPQQRRCRCQSGVAPPPRSGSGHVSRSMRSALAGAADARCSAPPGGRCVSGRTPGSSVRPSVRVRPLHRRRHVHRHELRHQKLQTAAAGQGCLPAGSLRCGNAGLASPRPSAGPSPPRPPLSSPRAGSGGRGPGAAVRAPR